MIQRVSVAAVLVGLVGGAVVVGCPQTGMQINSDAGKEASATNTMSPRADAAPSPVGLGPAITCGPGGRAMVDILLVVDNSHSMLEEQQNLAGNLPTLLDGLVGLPGGIPDLHVGVISSDVGAGTFSVGTCQPGGDRGRLLVRPGCGLEPGRHFLEVSGGGAQKNFTGELGKVLGCMASLGVLGCGYEHHLQSLRVAMTTSANGGPRENEGFLRPGAHLAVIILADEDDCSAPPNSDFFTQQTAGESGSLRCALAGHRCGGKPVPKGPFTAALDTCEAVPDGTKVLYPVKDMVDSIRSLRRDSSFSVVVIGGWPQTGQGQYRLGIDSLLGLDLLPTCSSGSGSAMPGLRLRQFASAFDDAGQMFSICNEDFRPAMQSLTDRIARGLPCR